MLHKVRKKKHGTYPYALVIFSTTISLFVLGILLSFLFMGNNLSRVVKENISVHIYLHNNLAQSEVSRIEKILGEQSFVQKKEGKKQILFISKEAAAKQFIRDTGEDFFQFLGDNPLRDAFSIKIDAEHSTKLEMKKARQFIEDINGVYEVDYKESLVEKINRNIHQASVVLILFSALLFVLVYLLMHSSIKLALFSQRFLIRSMQLVGAKMSFIQRPFLIRSFFHGFFSGLMASGLLVLVLYIATKQVNELTYIESNQDFYIIFGILTLSGGFIAWLSTFVAVKNYMRMSLDELYK